MPRRPSPPCPKPGCPHRKPCPVHRVQRSPDTRPSAAARGYDSKWRIIRAAYLKAHPVCVVCGQPATEIDHIIALEAGGSNDWKNLRAMCKTHHSRKTATIDGGFGNKRGGGSKSP